MKNIVIVVPCWKRSDVVKIILEQLNVFYLGIKNDVNLTVIYIFSPEDPEIDILFSMYLNADHPRDCILHENNKLGEKLNKGIRYAEKFQYDYIMNFGSDDLIHPDIMKLYHDALSAECDVIGLNKVYFWDMKQNPLLFSYYNKPNLVGAGRLIHRRVVKVLELLHGGLYSPEISRGMDTFSAKRMTSAGFVQTTVDPGEFPYIVDIKSDVNINSFESILNISSTGSIKEYSSDFIKEKFPIVCSLTSMK